MIHLRDMCRIQSFVNYMRKSIVLLFETEPTYSYPPVYFSLIRESTRAKANKISICLNKIEGSIQESILLFINYYTSNSVDNSSIMINFNVTSKKLDNISKEENSIKNYVNVSFFGDCVYCMDADTTHDQKRYQ